MNNLIKCARCNKVMISEEYDSHLCNPNLKGVKRLDVAYYSTSKDNMGRTVIIAKGLDGILYNITVRSRKESDKIPFDLAHSNPDTQEPHRGY